MKAIDRFIEGIAAGDLPSDVFAADAVLDATVPNWRFPVRGGPAVHAQLAGWYSQPARLEEMTRRPTPDGEVVELTIVSEESGVPFAARQIHVLSVDAASDRIVSGHVWCGGRFTAAALAEMEAAARSLGHAD